MPNRDTWMATGAAVAEMEKLNDEHIDVLREAFDFLREQSGDKTENLEEAFAWFEYGYNAYWHGRAFRIDGNPPWSEIGDK